MLAGRGGDATKGILIVDLIIAAAAIWFFLVAWLVLALLVTSLEPFVSLYDGLVLLWDYLGSLETGAGLLGLALKALLALAVILVLIGGWAMLPVWGFVALGKLGDRRDRRAVARHFGGGAT